MSKMLILIAALLLLAAGAAIAQEPGTDIGSKAILLEAAHNRSAIMTIPSYELLAFNQVQHFPRPGLEASQHTQIVASGIRYTQFDGSPTLLTAAYPMDNFTVRSGHTSGRSILIIVGTMVAIVGYLYLQHRADSE